MKLNFLARALIKVLALAGSVVLFLVSLLVFTIAFINYFALEHAFGKPDTPYRSCVLVFGAAVLPDGSPSQVLKDRVASALSLDLSCFLLSGFDSYYDVHEVDVMKEFLYGKLKENKPQKLKILPDYDGKNTCASIRNLSRFKGEFDEIVFLSSPFHMARIALLANKFGIERYKLVSSRNAERNIKSVYFYAREAVAFWYYMLFFDKGCKKDFRDLSINFDFYVNKVLKYFYALSDKNK